MRMTIDLDDDLVAKAQQLTGTSEPNALLHEALRALIARETTRSLVRLGGTDPGLRSVPRRRSPKR
jgi:Arc/MetJ family transcription regulator